MKTPKTLFIFNNSLVLCCDSDGKQIPELQRKNLLALWLETAEANGYDVSQLHIESRQFVFRPFKTQEGNWNFDITPR